MRPRHLRKPGATLTEIERVYRESFHNYVRVAGAISGENVAHDVVQDAFAAAVRARGRWRAEGPLEAWIWRLVVNRARDERRSSGRVAPVNEQPTVSSNGRAENETVRAALGALPERQRLVLFLRYYADLDYRTIAQTLEVDEGTVGASLHAARKRLRLTLQEVET
jgi:RNA polymerase sigma-70 factor (ECF subfamily)